MDNVEVVLTIVHNLLKNFIAVHWSSLVSELSVSFKHFPDVLHNFSGEITTPYSVKNIIICIFFFTGLIA